MVRLLGPASKGGLLFRLRRQRPYLPVKHVAVTHCKQTRVAVIIVSGGKYAPTPSLMDGDEESRVT